MVGTLRVLSRGKPAGPTANSAKLARFMGIEAVECPLLGQDTPQEAFACPPGESTCFVAKASDLLATLPNRYDRDQVKAFLLRGNHTLFLYGFFGTPEESSLLKELTEEAVTSCRSIDDSTRCYRMRYSCPLTGQCLDDVNFDIAESTKTVAFDLGDASCRAHVMMTVDEKPFLTKITLGESNIFLAGCHEIADLDDLVPKDISVLSFFSSLVPFQIFLRETFQKRCWHNDSPRACFIVDDPLLRMDYGFLNYQELLKVMQWKEMSSSIAFIPWNYRRTSKAVADLFLSHPERFSLSIHGCDHTAAEFGETDEALLHYKAKTALERLAIHQQVSGVPFDQVMIFPQGVFSTLAMKTLKSCQYLAAVNTTPYPIDIVDIPTLRDLLQVAVTRFFAFPLFLRHYPMDFAELAFDLFLGKPALLVEHHGYFQGGFDALIAIVEKLKAIDQRLEWTSLAEICSRNCLKRLDASGEIHIRFYTDTFRLKNDSDRHQFYVLFRGQAFGESAARVTVNGQRADYCQEGDQLRITLELDALESAEIKIEHEILDPTIKGSAPKFTDNVKTLFRRVLSETRDNYLDRYPFLARGVAAARDFLSK